MEIVTLTEYRDGTPQLAPDENGTRQDPFSGQGLITGVGTKRKIRDFAALLGQSLYVARRAVLSHAVNEAAQALGVEADANQEEESPPIDEDKETEPEPKSKGKSKGKSKAKGKAKKEKNKELDYEVALKVRDELCRRYWDIRAFGAVLCSPVNIPVRGPLQVGMARSVDPINPLTLSITRVAVATDREAEEQKGRNHTMGTQTVVPYGVYQQHHYYNPHDAEVTGFSQEDFEIYLRALREMHDHTRSCMRTEVVPRKIVIFRHSCPLGNAPSHKLFELVKLTKKPGVPTPTCWEDYEFSVDVENLPEGVEIEVIG
jgi:CRISPR-associated protein Csd2